MKLSTFRQKFLINKQYNIPHQITMFKNKKLQCISLDCQYIQEFLTNFNFNFYMFYYGVKFKIFQLQTAMV